MLGKHQILPGRRTNFCHFWGDFRHLLSFFVIFCHSLSFSRKFRHFLGPGPNFSSGLMPIQKNKIVSVFLSKHFIPVIPLTLYLLCFTKILIFQILNSEKG